MKKKKVLWVVEYLRYASREWDPINYEAFDARAKARSLRSEIMTNLNNMHIEYGVKYKLRVSKYERVEE
jgi:hypothetical protein